MPVARGAPTGVPPTRRGIILRTRPRFHELRVRIVAARGQDHAFSGVDLHVLVAALGDDAAHASRTVAHQLHARRAEAQVEVVVGLRHLLHLEAHVDARIAGAHSGVGRQRGAVVEAQLRVDERGQRRHAAGGGSLLHLRDDEAVLSLVEFGLPEIGSLARTVDVGAYGFGAHAPVRAAVHLVQQRHLVDLGALLALRPHGAEALEAAAALRHLLDADDFRALFGCLEAGHEPGDTRAHHHDVAILGRSDVARDDVAVFEADRPARPRAGRLLHRHKRRLARKLPIRVHRFGDGSIVGEGDARRAQRPQRTSRKARQADPLQERATRYVVLSHSPSLFVFLYNVK